MLTTLFINFDFASYFKELIPSLTILIVGGLIIHHGAQAPTKYKRINVRPGELVVQGKELV